MSEPKPRQYSAPTAQNRSPQANILSGGVQLPSWETSTPDDVAEHSLGYTLPSQPQTGAHSNEHGSGDGTRQLT
jgi:hypothetical protein